MRKVTELLKDFAYVTITKLAEKTWKVIKPRTHGARVLLVTETHILLAQRRASDNWTLPGGGISKNENYGLGALRELREETNISLDHVDFLLGTYLSSKEGKRDTVYIVVKKIEKTLEAQPTFEIQNAQWFPLNELPEKTTPATKFRIQEYLAGKRNIQGKWLEYNF